MKVQDKIETLCKEKHDYYDVSISQALDLLPSLKKAIGGKNGKIYAQVNTVAKSGMSRTVSLFIIHKGEIINLNSTVFAHVYGDTVTRDYVRIGGCGMDMLFECTYRLYHFLFSRKRPYQKHLNRYIQL